MLPYLYVRTLTITNFTGVSSKAETIFIIPPNFQTTGGTGAERGAPIIEWRTD